MDNGTQEGNERANSLKGDIKKLGEKTGKK